MNFINKYKNGKAETRYYYAAEFSEAGGTVIYAIGHLGDLPIITKTKDNGDVIWEKVYQPSTQVAVSFKKIIQVSSGSLGSIESSTEKAKAQPVAQYIVYGTNANGAHWLMSIATNGAVYWYKELIGAFSSSVVLLEPSRTDNGFYIVISSTSSSGHNPYAVKFNSAGSLERTQTLVPAWGKITINSFKSHSDGIVLVGHISSSDLSSDLPSDSSLKSSDLAVDSSGFALALGLSGILIELDTSFTIVTAWVAKVPPLSFHDIEISAPGNYLLSGFLYETKSLFVATVKSGKFIDIQYFPRSQYTQSRLCLGKGYFYFVEYKQEDGTIHRMNPDLSIQWTKTINFNFPGEGNGISFLNFQLLTINLTTTAFNQTLQSLLVHTDADLNSCKTLVLEKPKLVPIDAAFNEFGISFQRVLLRILTIEFTDFFNEPVKEEHCPAGGGGGTVGIGGNTKLQSPNFYIQGAGSTGADGSARGIHLRWLFNGALGRKHLPKGDYAATAYNFNRPDDYVRVYRAAYIKAQTVLNFSATPYLTDDTNKVWLYRVGTKVFYVYFRNTDKYTQVRATYTPSQDPMGFINAYGNELLEIENKKELFFAAEINANVTGLNARLRTETLSVAENALAASKILSSRKTYTGSSLNGLRLVCENGRSIRIHPTACNLANIYFEFYSDFILATNSKQGWQLIDKYALTLDDATAFGRLEPAAALVDGKWQRYNDNAFVNTSNYQHKWNGPRQSWDRNIKGVAQQYITLSNAQNNPQALENVPLGSGASTGDDVLELSNLDLLNMSAYDFHVARMLGLGTLDVSTLVTGGQSFIYIGQYTTTGDLEDGDGARTVDHLAMSLPVSINDQRLPLAVKLATLTPGAFWGNESPEPVNLTDANGYTQDGRNRYVTIYSETLPDDEVNKPFYYTSREFNAATFTYPVYAGLEYKKNSETEWAKPELPNDPKYQNKVLPGATAHNETIPLVMPDPQKPLFVHLQKVSGTHYYGSYGINWFSRSTSDSNILSIITNLQPLNPLKPPSNINVLLVRKERPLLLTSQYEQDRYNDIDSGLDHTLVRLTFDYHSFQELIDYTVPLGANINDTNVIPADNTEIFADRVNIFFRNQVPGNVSGKALSITDDPTSTVLSVIQTSEYVLTSSGQTLTPSIPAGTASNYVGGLFIMGDQQFIIHQVTLPTGGMQGPAFTVFKKEISNGIVTNEMPSPGAQNLESPQIIPDGLFMAVENMQNTASWGTPNPLPLQVNIGTGWTVNREVITIVNDDGSTEQHLEKTRGIWDNADVQPVPEPVDGGGSVHKGLYKITFQNVVLPQHAQYDNDGTSVEWYQGIVRVHTVLNPNAARKTIKVMRIENIATANKLVLYAYDPSFVTDLLYDKIKTGITSVNYYPGYKLYLYANVPAGLTEANILPLADEDVHYSIFGLRSHDIDGNYYSKISIPQLMFAQQQIAPVEPEQPAGSLYATRPDFFGRATYTFTTKYPHRPFGVLTCRADDEALLNALYKPSTIIAIRASLQAAGGDEDPYFANRWKNFINFTEIYQQGDYKIFPPTGAGGYKFPNPDNPAFFAWANSILTSLGQPTITATSGTLAAGHLSIREFVKGAIFNAFVPLTEVPVIFQHIKGGDHRPSAKKQVIRDKNGNILKPDDDGFEMAPMMRITGGANDETSFTDFTLDGTSNNIYFYGVRELNAQMQMSGFSPFLGPVKLVNTNPPEAPEIKRIMPVLENAPMRINASIQLEVNAYPSVQKVKRLSIYRALNQLDAQSVRSMQLVKTIDLDSEDILTEPIWQVTDQFEDLTEIPYNDGLYYRVTALRKIEYADMDGNVITEYAPSQPSKLTATLITETYNPDAPELSYTSDAITLQGDLHNVKLQWHKTAYKAKYHVYKMNASGNWIKIHEISSNAGVIALPLVDTDLQSGTLNTKDADGNTVYHHFKIVAENTSGMLSLGERILTVVS